MRNTCLVSAIICTMPLPALGNELTNYVVEQMRADLSRDGSWAPQSGWVGHLRNGGTVNLSLRADTSGSVKIYGNCDGDCDDLDIVVYNANGQMVAQDVATDDVPIVTFSGSRRPAVHSQGDHGQLHKESVLLFGCSTYPLMQDGCRIREAGSAHHSLPASLTAGSAGPRSA